MQVAVQESTKDKILDAAERLFAEHGYKGTSLRNVITAAGVNLAAVHYHYGSKEALLDAIVERRASPVNIERLQLLEEIERAADGKPSLEMILEALMGPAFRLSKDPQRGKTVFPRLMARLHSEGGDVTRKILQKHFGEVLPRFLRAIHSAVPELPMSEMFWRWHFAIGAMAHSLSVSPEELQRMTEGLLSLEDAEITLERIVQFLAAGFRASSTTRSPE
jgi:AcrR family transcriptional regulator